MERGGGGVRLTKGGNRTKGITTPNAESTSDCAGLVGEILERVF